MRVPHLLVTSMLNCCLVLAFWSHPTAQAPADPPVNPLPATPESIAAGKMVYDTACAGCHAERAQGAVKAGYTISAIEDRGGKQPPDLTDAEWDHGSSDGHIFLVIKRGVPPMMAAWDGRITDTDIWHMVNYIRSLAATRP